VRDQVAEMIAAGKSDREILDEFVSRYGARILIEPEGARSWWLYLIPIVALTLGIFWATRFLARLRKRILSVEGASGAAVDDSEWDW
jgi:cytochrome c-type biogenesis protein CcmH/NrfF